MANLLITGGAGFIGSHTCLVLLERGHSLVVLDDFSNSHPVALERVASLVGLQGLNAVAPGHWRDPVQGRLSLHRGDIRNPQDLESVLAGIDAVLHFAGLKSVGESVHHPLRYWDVNVSGTRLLLEQMQQHGCRTLVFSSSASIYGTQERVPIPESAPIQPINPYGRTKATVEQLLADLVGSEPGWRVACLRYFNPVGAHASGLIGEDPSGVPNNLFPYISQVASGLRPCLSVYGDDWDTPDGTGVRDYIHVMDLAEGHVAAVEHLISGPDQLLQLNLGSGRGHSVLDLVHAFATVSGRPVPWQVAPRRPGDPAISVADAELAASRLGWRTRRTLEDMCRDGWAWQAANPRGYTDRVRAS
ncbi:MAG: UDP-glucose 4-epimerase GalE [Synechococcaceae cyanobacterium]|nr:UDP-glucose 4-epimerase GalE [Synechococcaceae cyanobacterium]